MNACIYAIQVGGNKCMLTLRIPYHFIWSDIRVVGTLHADATCEKVEKDSVVNFSHCLFGLLCNIYSSSANQSQHPNGIS